MATANEQLQSSMLKRRSLLQLLSRKLGLDMQKALDSTHRGVKGMLADEIPKIHAGLNTATSAGRFATIGNQYKNIRKPIYDSIEKEYTVAMARLANDEAEFIAKSLQRSIPFDVALSAPSASAINNLTAFAAYDGASVSQWFTKTSVSDYARIEATVRASINNGFTLDQTINSVIGTKSRLTGKYTGAVQVSRNQIETLSRTVTNGVANGANQEFYKANADIIDYEVYSAVLDGRTSVICASLDGTKFKTGEGEVPPLHPNCRSARIPVIDGVGLIGNRPSVGGTNFRDKGKKDYINRNKKRGITDKAAKSKWNNLSNSSKNGYINRARREYGKDVIGSQPPGTTYSSWLKKQDGNLQSSVLGVENAKKFRSGEMTLDKFTDRLGKPLTLEELRGKFPEVYD